MRHSLAKRIVLAGSATVVVFAGCQQRIFETVLGSLRNLTTETATEAINTAFEQQFGLPAEDSEGEEEESGNDRFVHI